ncbi:hypothetical protein F383_21950 [Gossypium arboreum]|uniref:Uncharacterized protein n=1 Tax=Gossypium arboreum TaxID=29729 RepID=A0A0B0NUS9_GOSAR|nr:hypothetical protein F383_21950 [Gossypium arboreum]
MFRFFIVRDFGVKLRAWG